LAETDAEVCNGRIIDPAKPFDAIFEYDSALVGQDNRSLAVQFAYYEGVGRFGYKFSETQRKYVVRGKEFSPVITVDRDEFYRRRQARLAID